jgi:hypothetical protein
VLALVRCSAVLFDPVSVSSRYVGAFRTNPCTTFLNGALPWHTAPPPAGSQNILMGIMWLVLPLDGKWWYSTASFAELKNWRSDILCMVFRDPEGSDHVAAAKMLTTRPVSADVGSWQCLFCSFCVHASGESNGNHDVDCTSPVLFMLTHAENISSQESARSQELITTVSARTYNEDKLRAGLSASFKNAQISDLVERLSVAESLAEETAEELTEVRVANETRDRRLSSLEEQNALLRSNLDALWAVVNRATLPQVLSSTKADTPHSPPLTDCSAFHRSFPH